MIFVVLRYVILALVLWLVWRLCAAMIAARRPPRARPQDEWGEVLEAIDELPVTTDPHPRIEDQRQSVQDQHHQYDGAGSQANIESVIVHEAEAALSLMRHGDETERLPAYHEITTYAKLCNSAECNISMETQRKIDDIRRQAWEIICPPERN